MYLLDLFKKYLLSQQNSPSQLTVKNYLADIRKFISWFQNTFNQEFKAQEVSYETIQQFKDAFASETAISSIERYVSSLRKFFHFLKIEGIISHDPFSDTPKETIEEADPFRLKAFKNFLYVYNASALTIKNYIIDVKQFFAWAKEVAKNENGQDVTDQEILNSVSNKLLETYRDRLYSQNIFSASSINRKLSSLRKYLSWAKEQGIITDSKAHISFVKKPEVTTLSQSTIEAILSKETPVIVTEKPRVKEEQAAPSYSPFPPIRLLQKSLSGLDFLIEKIIVTWLFSLINLASNRIWELRGKPVFDRKLSRFVIKKPSRVTNLPKELYAPTKMSTKNFTWFQKVWFHVRFTRPEWYRRYHTLALARYFNLAVLIVLSTVIGFTAYYALIGSRGAKSPVLAAAPVAPLRILSFQGRLTDNNGNPITTATNLRFVIYNDPTASAGARLWEEVDRVSPDTDGIFSLLLGSNGTGGNATLCNSGNPPSSPATGACGIPQSLFAQNSGLYMGVTVESTPELTPRQQIATVAYATNAEVLQGLPPITDASVVSNANAVLALNSSGVVAIPGSTNPTTTIQATSSNIKLTGQTTILATNAGSNGDIQLNPDGLGKIDVFRPLQNTSFTGNISTALGAVEIDSIASILATSSGQSAFTIEQDSTGPLISASVSGTAKFTVDNTGQVQAASFYDINNTAYFLDPNSVGNSLVVAGSVGIGTTNPSSFKLQVAGHVGPNNDNLFDLGSSTLRWRNIYGVAINTNNIYLPVAGGTEGFWQLANNVITPSNVANDLAVGGNGTASATFQAFGSDLNGPAATVAATTNFAGFIVTNTLGDLITASSSGQTRFVITQSGNIGVGTAIPNAPLQVAKTGNSVFLGDNTNSTTYISANNRAFIGYDGQYAIFQGASSHGIRLQTTYGNTWDSGTLVTLQPYGTVTIGTTTYGNGALVVNQQNLSGSGDIFSASSSGTTRFTIENDGTLASTKYKTGGGIFFTDSNGVFTQTTAGGTNQCLQSTGGGTPTWGACGSGTGGSNWVLNSANGTLYPINNTLDVLVGVTDTTNATQSAKFAVLNISGGTPTASVSAQDGTNRALSLIGNGTIQGAQNNNITIGGNTTGNITLSPLNGGTGSNLFINSLTTTFSGTNPVLTTTSNNPLAIYAGTGTVTLGTTSSGGNIQFFSGTNFITNAGSLTIGGSFTLPNSVVLQGVATQLQVNSGLLVNSTGATAVKTSIDTSGNILPGSDGSANIGAPGDAWNNLYVKNIHTPITGGTDGYWQLNGSVLSPTWSALDLAVGGTGTGSAFQVFGLANGSIPAGTASTSGYLTFTGSASQVNLLNNGSLGFYNSVGGNAGITTSKPALYIANTGYVGLGTTNPTANLTVQGNANSIAGLGAEMITNAADRTFSSNTGNWTDSTSWHIIGNGFAQKDTVGANNLTLTNSALSAAPASGNTYQISFAYTSTASSSGSITFSFGSTAANNAYADGPSQSGTDTEIITAAGAGSLIFQPSNNWYGTITSVSVKQLTSNSAPVAKLLNSDGTAGLELRSGGSGLNNSFIGVNSGLSVTTGNDNVGLGNYSLQNNTSGQLNAAIGYQALKLNTSGIDNTAVGATALTLNTSGQDNTAIGQQSLNGNTTGSYNTAIGSLALNINTAGANSVAVGYGAGYGNVTGAYSNDVFVGYETSWAANSLPTNSTQLGYKAGYNTGGTANTLLGYQAGYDLSSGNYNIALGQNVDLPSNTSNQQLNIGNLIYGTGLYNGNTVSSTPVTNGTVGIGIASPIAKLEVAGNTSLSLANGNTTDLAAFDDSTFTNLFRVTATGGIEQIGGQNTPFGGIGNYENLMIYSQGAFSGSAYSGYWSLPTTTDNATQSAAPDGTYTATQAITPSSWPVGSSQGYVQNITSFPNSGPYTVSIWLKGAVGGESVQLGANDSNSGNIFTLTTTWKRYTYSTNNLTASGSPRGFQIKLWSLNSTYYLWGAQAERRNYPGVYIATTSSPVVPSPAGYNAGLVINATGSAIFAGKVGIATNSAQYTLDVNGDIRSTGYTRDQIGGVAGANMIPLSADGWSNSTSFWKLITGQAATITTVATNSAVPTGIVHQFTNSSLAGWYYIDQLIPVDPQRTYYGRIWAVRTSGTGTFYAGYIAYDQNLNVLHGNGGTYGYFIASAQNPTASGTWYYGKVQGEGTANTTFPVGTRYIKPLIIVNYNTGGTMQVSMPEISDRPFEQDNNTYDIATSGISRLYVDPTGNVGIGTTANLGNAELVVNQPNLAGTNGDIITASYSGQTEFTVKSSGQLQARSFYDLDNTNYFLDPNALTTAMAVAGSVGVGTTAPDQKLEVYNSGATYMHINSTTQQVWVGAAVGGGSFNSITVANDNQIIYGGQSIGTANGLVIAPWMNATSGIRLDGNGNVGIGTTSEPNPLTVKGGTLTAATSSTYAFSAGNTNASDITLGSDASFGYMQTWNSKPLLLNSQGNNVGIGTTGTPRSKLDVYGDLTVGTGTISGDYGMINFPSSDNDNGFIYACSTQNGGCATNTFDLRVYLQDDNDDSETFSIWGGSCANGGCSQGTTNAAEHAWISAAGNASFSGKVTVGGTSGVVWSAGSSYEAFVTSTSNLYITDTGHTSPPTINVQKNQHVCISCFNADPKILQVGAACLNIGSNTCGDVAEYYHASSATDKGDIITIDNDSSASANVDTTGKLVKKAAVAYDKGLLGVVSTNPAITIEGNSVGLMAGGYTAEPLHPAVAEIGKVPTKVSTINGPIHSGDRITSSSIPGIGMKATQDGVTIGPALEDFDPAHNLGQQIVCPSDAPPGVVCGLIYVYMQTGEYNPNSQLANTNEFSLQQIGATAYQILDNLGNVVTHVDTYSQALIASLQAGFVQAQHIATNSLAVATNNITIAGQSLQDYIITVVQNAGLVSSTHIISPLAEIDTIHTNIISPLSNTGNISLSFEDNTLSIRNGTTTNSAVVAQIDNSGNATFSGTLNSENLAVNSDATVSGTLHAGRIVANEIDGLSAAVGTLSAQNITNVTNIYFATPSSDIANAGTASAQNLASSYSPTLPGGYTNLASFSAYLAYVPQLSATTATFAQGLMSLGPTSLSDTTITGQLSIGAQFILSDNSINVLGGDLQLQPLAQGGVSIAAGQVKIDQNGNLTVNGKAVFNSSLAVKVLSPLPNQDLSVQLGDSNNPNPSSQFKVTNATGSAVFAVNQLGDVVASGTATVAKLNLELAPPAYAVSDTEVQATGSAGTTQINSYQKEITIDNPLVTDKSLIYITPVGDTGQIPVLMRQVPGISFTVGIPQPNATATQFNWLIVN
ncbi:MAG TPA: site-specific integrase [Patescibacteria group bacterium]